MAANSVRIGVACPVTGERAAFLEWLTLAGYEPMPMLSIEGVRLEITGASPGALPLFTLRVPGFGVAAKVKRVWVAMPAQGSMWCGGILER